jgi:nitrite reductase/ring-hydroxylating ferredoxin subunit
MFAVKEASMNWVKALLQDELPEGERRAVKIGERSILLIHEQGHVYAMASACPHMRLPLKGGKLTENGAIVCPWHHSAFDLRSGDVKEWSPWPPGVGRMLGAISREKALPVFPTKVEDGSVWVSLEELQ